MRTYIRVSEALRQELITIFEVDRTTVYRALHHITTAGHASDIRSYALAHGGREVREEFIPDCATEHTDGQVKQTFARGTTVIIDTATGHAEIRQGDQTLLREDNISNLGWGNLLFEAQMYSQQRLSAAI